MSAIHDHAAGVTTPHQASPGQLRSGLGSSADDDPVTAGRLAAETAVARAGGETPALVLVFSSVRYDLSALLSGIRQATGNAPVVGATSAGHFLKGEMVPPSTGVAVLALTGDRYRFGVAATTGLRADAFSGGRTLAREARAALPGPPPRHSAIMLLVDAMVGEQQAILNGIYRVTGAAIPVVGGAAGDDHRLMQTFVFHNERVLTDAAVAVWIGSDHPIRITCSHSWEPVGLPLLVTRVDGTIVHEIAGRPAREVFEEHFRHEGPLHELVWKMPTGHYTSGAFGLIEPDGSLLIRGAFLDGDGNLRTFAPLPVYSAVHIVSSQQEEMLKVGDEVIADTLAGVPDPTVLLAFSCVSRLDLLRDRGPEEAAVLQAAAGPVPTFGYYTYGEFARVRSVAGYHNSTIAAVAL